MKNIVVVQFPFKKPGVFKWTQETIGPGRWNMGNTKPYRDDVWRAYKTSEGMCFEFLKESDLTMFILRFGNDTH